MANINHTRVIDWLNSIIVQNPDGTFSLNLGADPDDNPPAQFTRVIDALNAIIDNVERVNPLKAGTVRIKIPGNSVDPDTKGFSIDPLEGLSVDSIKYGTTGAAGRAGVTALACPPTSTLDQPVIEIPLDKADRGDGKIPAIRMNGAEGSTTFGRACDPEDPGTATPLCEDPGAIQMNFGVKIIERTTAFSKVTNDDTADEILRNQGVEGAPEGQCFTLGTNCNRGTYKVNMKVVGKRVDGLGTEQKSIGQIATIEQDASGNLTFVGTTSESCVSSSPADTSTWTADVAVISTAEGDKIGIVVTGENGKLT
jgi:hypothetical protein